MPAAPQRSLLRKIAFGLLGGFLVFVAVALIGDLRSVAGRLGEFRWLYFLPALGLTLFNYTLRFFKWDYYLHLLGVRLPRLESARLFVGGFPLAVTPGKTGEVLKAIWLQAKSGLPAAKGVSVVAAERISDGLAVLILSILGVVSYPRYWPAFAILLAGLVSLIVIVQIWPLAERLLGIAAKLPLLGRAAGSLYEFYEGSAVLFQPKAVLTGVGLGTVSWLGEGIGFYLILLGLGLEPGWVLLSQAVFVLAFSTVVGAVSALPGGLGAAEASIAGMLAFTAGLDGGLAASATLLIRLATLWFGVSLGLAVWAVSPQLLGLGEGNGKIGEPAG